MKWTTDLPTEPGWYWVKNDFDIMPTVYFITEGRMFLSERQLHNAYSGRLSNPPTQPFEEKMSWHTEHNARFAGPLRPPEEE